VSQLRLFIRAYIKSDTYISLLPVTPSLTPYIMHISRKKWHTYLPGEEMIDCFLFSGRKKNYFSSHPDAIISFTF
jgi:hypothetical protein